MKLKDARKNSKMSQELIANMLGITRQTYSKIESGKIEITLKQFLILSSILEITIFDFN